MPVVESNAAKYLKRQRLNKNCKASADTTSFRSSPETEQFSSGSKDNGKSVSLAIQAKINVQGRQRIGSSSSEYLVSKKDLRKAMSNQSLTSQQSFQKSLPKLTAKNHAGFPMQNNQNQKGLVDKDESAKSAVSNSQGSKALSGNSSKRQKPSGKTVGSKNGTRKLGSEATKSEKGISSYSIKQIPREKRSIDGNLRSGKNRVVGNRLFDSNRKNINSSPAFDRRLSLTKECKREGMNLPSGKYNVRSISSSASFSQDLKPALDSGGYNKGRNVLLVYKSGSSRHSVLSSPDPAALRVKHLFQDFALVGTSEIINPHLFNCSESQKDGLISHRSEMVRRKEWPAEEILKEISAWRSIKNFMADEFVDKRTSRQCRCLDSEVDAFVLGIEIEGHIYNNLLDEEVASFIYWLEN